MQLKKFFTKNLLMLVFILFTVTMVSGALTPLWGHYVITLGGDLRSAGIAVAVLNIGFAIFNAICAIFEDKYPYYRLYIVMSSALLIICWLLYSLVQTTYQLYAVLLLISFALALQFPAFDTLYTHYLPQESEAKGWALYGTCESIGSGIGAIIGTHVVHYLEYRTFFFTMSLISALGFIVSLIILTTGTDARVKPDTQ